MRTSINLRKSDVSLILSARDISGLSRSQLICRCLNRYLCSNYDKLRTSKAFRLVEYQDDGVGYEVFNVVFDASIYNLAVSFRVFCRLSVSKMVTIAISQYLKEILMEELGRCKQEHNYVEFFFVTRHNERFLSQEWTIAWKINKRKAKK